MSRKWLKANLPSAEHISQNRYLHWMQPWLAGHYLWTLHRRNMARAVAIGLFAGLMPGPTQMLTGGVMALLLRANLPLTLFVTLYTNPLTIVPLYLLAYRYGTWLLGTDTQANISMAPDFSLATFGSWLAQMVDWVVSLGPALLVGLPALGLSFAVVGYLLVIIAWRGFIVYLWHRRKVQRAAR